MRSLALAALLLMGCHSDDAKLKADVERLTKENDGLRAEVKRLLKEEEARALEDTDDEEESDEDVAPPAVTPPSSKAPKKTELENPFTGDDRGSGDLMDPFAVAKPAELEAMKQAYLAGDYKKARSLSSRTAHVNAAANRIFGAASCFLKDVRGAKVAYAHAADQDQQFLRYVCQRNAIALP